METELINVPSFNFIFDDEGEALINVQFYNGTISLQQRDQDINISTLFLNDLFKAIKKNLPEATEILAKR